MNFKQYVATLMAGFLISTGLILWNTFGGGSLSVPLFFVILLVVVAVSFKWAKRTFLVFVMLLALENIIVAPEQLPIGLRPYQMVGAILFTVLVGQNLLMKKGEYFLLGLERFSKNKKRLMTVNLLDKLILFLPIFALLAVVNAPNGALSAKLAVILFSFVILYWLIRSFVRSKKEIVETLLFFVFGSVPVIFWSFYQAVAKLAGWRDFQVFTARVNGTFTEPDWLGVYLTLMLAILLWFRYLAKPDKSNLMIASFGISQIFGFFVNLYFIVAFSVLILTVSRSAWLGVLGVYLVYFLLLVADKVLHRTFSIAQIGKNLLVIGLLSFLAIALISVTKLSTFHFGNRAASSVRAKQLITISCEKQIELPSEIREMEDLDIFGCRHINLEEIEAEKEKMMFVTTIMRPDPNVNIRKEIYHKTWGEIKKYPILGQGLGSAASFLGQDEHGSGLNTSNIVLEIFLSMGLLAVSIAVFIVLRLLVWSGVRIYNNKNHIFSSFVILSGVAIIVPNMFNAGLLMGMFWFWLAMAVSTFVLIGTGKETS